MRIERGMTAHRAGIIERGSSSGDHRAGIISGDIERGSSAGIIERGSASHRAIERGRWEGSGFAPNGVNDTCPPYM